MNLERRCQILVEYAKWTALSAVKQGPIRAKEPVYRLLDEVAFSKMLNPSLGPISCNEFNEWHRCQTNDLCAQAKPYLPSKWVETHPGREFPVGWGTKLINVFLKDDRLRWRSRPRGPSRRAAPTARQPSQGSSREVLSRDSRRELPLNYGDRDVRGVPKNHRRLQGGG